MHAAIFAYRVRKRNARLVVVLVEVPTRPARESPGYACMWARVNAAGPLGADGVANLGFADPLIYANNADSAKHAASFTDIIVGANGLYPALPGIRLRTVYDHDTPTAYGVSWSQPHRSAKWLGGGELGLADDGVVDFVAALL